jgi:hypothetical protein
MEDKDRAFLMSRTAAPGSSMEQLINMAYEGNTNNVQPYRAPVLAEQSNTALPQVE